MSKPLDPRDSFLNSPAMQSMRSFQERPAERQREFQRSMDSIQEANERKQIAEGERIEREQVTADATVAVAAWAQEQSEENRRLRYLTNVLAFAVIYDVVNGSFDDHTWWTTLISATAGAAVFGGSVALGRLRRRRQSRIDAEAS